MHKKTNSKIKVSVILPVWNPGPGISRCIESLQAQTLKEIEMIFIDDCGTDNSMEKVRAAAVEDDRIWIIVNEENIGAGPSRNKGIDMARGEYLSFVDPDDYVACDFLELLYTDAHKFSYDIVKGSMVHIKEDGLPFARKFVLNQHIIRGLSSNKSLYSLFTYEHQSGIYRRELLLKQNVRYGDSARGQDTTFLLKVCSNAKTFSVVDRANYYFCARPGSAMHTMDEVRLYGHLQSIIDKVDCVMNNITLDEEACSYLQGLFLSCLRECSRYDQFPEMRYATSNYLLGLRKQMERVNLSPDNLSVPLRVFMCYDAVLPSMPYFSPWEGNDPPVRYAQLVERWVDFYLNKPEEQERCRSYLKKFIIRAVRTTNKKRHSTYTREEKKQGRSIINNQIKRLPLKLRFQIEWLRAKDELRLSK